jgi:two-component system nitrogen regulation sensor histidine kinase NtrY
MAVVFASILFQSGIQFWFSDRARGMLENAASIAQASYDSEIERVSAETVTMSGDLVAYLNDWGLESPLFAEGFGNQVYRRNLSEAIIVRITPEAGIQSLALVNYYDRPLDKVVTPEMVAALEESGKASVLVPTKGWVGALTRLDYGENTYLYAARVFNPKLAHQLDRSATVVSDYHTLLDRSRDLQFRFNAALIVISLLIVAVTIWIALALADRLIRPVGQLVTAARQVTGGDLSSRVPLSKSNDELGTLSNAFNRMTRRLEEQTRDLVNANSQLETRRALIEAVLSGVTAGVISVDKERKVRLINSSAEALLDVQTGEAVGQSLNELAPELAAQLESGEREDIIQFTSAGEPRTLAVKRSRVEGGHVITFDDMTEQLLNQRRAAWSDVARRIAHEIKNPLTPIQLAAERLQRRYGAEVTSDAATFERLTSTIVRQVNDLRRMVDEFSSFARMPKPVFREEPIAEVARHALFLHEVAHPEVRFSFTAPEPSPMLVCDRRQLGQALTNIVKNAVEAIQQKREDGEITEEQVVMHVYQVSGQVHIDVEDSGVGLPAERGNITEPYVTTRAKGTGLGLAIVKKIVEEHFGSMAFEDLPGGGTRVRLVFDADVLAAMCGGDDESTEEQVATH